MKHNANSYYYKRAKKQIQNLLANFDFQNDLKRAFQEETDIDLDLKNLISIDTPSPLLHSYDFHNLVDDYSIILSAKCVIEWYGTTGDIDYDKIDCPVKVVQEGTTVLLQISPDITQPELKDYILKHYKSDIEPALLATGVRKKVKVGGKYDVNQHSTISFLYDLGINPKVIAQKTGYSLEQVKSSLDKRKKKNGIHREQKELSKLLDKVQKNLFK